MLVRLYSSSNVLKHSLENFLSILRSEPNHCPPAVPGFTSARRSKEAHLPPLSFGAPRPLDCGSQVLVRYVMAQSRTVLCEIRVADEAAIGCEWS